jgi:hypothetical protein
MHRNVPYRIRVRLERKRNEDEDADEKLYTLIKHVPGDVKGACELHFAGRCYILGSERGAILIAFSVQV